MKISDNKEKSRFETEVDGQIAFIEYNVMPGIIIITHTEVPKTLEGKGIASDLTEQVLLQIERRGLKVVPSCGFTKSYISKHNEWISILADGQSV